MSKDKDLNKSYDLIGNKIYDDQSLSRRFLQKSLDLFTKKSLIIRDPKPIDVDVIALVSGLSFSNNLIAVFQKLITEISKILEKTLCYWVKPKNYGVEYCVFKWPNDIWCQDWLNEIISFLESKEYYSFELNITGIQLHQDGCIIAKGYDCGKIRSIRSDLKSNLKFVPDRQSNWAHVPLGRILEPVSGKKFINLKETIKKFSLEKLGSEKINDAKIVHEKRWYMEKKEILFNKKFKL
jgi:hypothetical protein